MTKVYVVNASQIKHSDDGVQSGIIFEREERYLRIEANNISEAIETARLYLPQGSSINRVELDGPYTETGRY